MNKSTELKNKLKLAGINTKNISIRYNGHYNIRIKDLSINLNKVEEIARSFEKIDYCHVSGEILQGGNTFVSCQIDYETLTNARESKEFLDFHAKVEHELLTSNYAEVAKGFTVRKFQDGSDLGFYIIDDSNRNRRYTQYKQLAHVVFDTFLDIKQENLERLI